MSLFPAYADTGSGATEEKPESPSKTSEWLANNSFQELTKHQQTLVNEKVTLAGKSSLPVCDTSDLTVISSSSTDSNSESNNSDVQLIDEKPEKSRKSTKKKKRQKEKSSSPPEKTLEFDGEEDFYVDKKPIPGYKTVNTLHRPACPRYHRAYNCRLDWNGTTGSSFYAKESKSSKRYYRELRHLKNIDLETPTQALDENEYTLRLGQLNRKVMEAPSHLQHWLDLISLQDQNPYKWSRLLLAEKKIDILKRAMVYHPRHDTLYRKFVETVSDTYPSFEVSKLFDGILNKDPYSYTVWTAQIMTTQGSMARCIVPDVLRIYERCMQKMYHNQKQPPPGADQFDSDGIMMRLFNNCALFLRQSGLYEQFFALIKLALELNVSIEQFNCFIPNDADQRTLIEYEELILQSGLPMNEIWLRIEKLRQCFNFLPCPVNSQCSDPQRIVFNEDVCHYIYPLKNMDNSFYLMLLVLRLIKVPFVQCDRLADKFSARVDAIGDSDAVEEALAVGVPLTYATYQTQQQENFFESLCELAREMAVTPTFLSSSVGYELYVKCITDLLQSASSACSGIDERKRIVFLLLLCRFERLRLVLEKAFKKLTPQYVKNGRSRFKAMLKQAANRNCLILYTEFALYEFEALERNASLDAVINTFESIISSIEEAFAYDLANTYVKYTEILIGRGKRDEALQVLASYVLKVDIKQKSSISEARKLSALQQISEKVDGLIAIERNVEIMVLEQYILPDQTVTLLKMKMLLQYLIRQKLESLTYLEKLLNMFCEATDRHQFLRERIYEIYVIIAQLPDSNCIVSNAALSKQLFEATKEFPRNLYFLQNCGMLVLPWYRIRTAMLGKVPNILSVTFLIAAARYRFIAMLTRTTELEALMPTLSFLECDQQHNESTVRNRILNIFQLLTSSLASEGGSSGSNSNVAQKALRRNALFWRYYLRCLSDQRTAFETSKKCLLTALDDCPWSKALYMDGATYVPQELSHLQDLMIEKQLRVYALPEELEILRER